MFSIGRNGVACTAFLPSIVWRGVQGRPFVCMRSLPRSACQCGEAQNMCAAGELANAWPAAW